MSDNVKKDFPKLDLSVLQSATNPVTNLVTTKDDEIESVEDLMKVETNQDDNDDSTQTTDQSTEPVIEDTDIEDISTIINQNPTPSNSEDSNKTPESNTPQSNDKPDLLKVFSNNLSELGVIDFNEEDYEKAEDKDEYLQSKVTEKIIDGADRLLKEKLGELPPQIEELIKLHKEGVPLYEVLEADKNIDTIESITIEDINADEDLQKELVKALYKSKGLPSENIDNKIKRLTDVGQLADEALDSYKILLKDAKAEKEKLIETRKQEKLERDRANQKQIEDIKSTIKSKNEILGFKLTDKDKETLIKGMLEPIGKDKNGNPYNAIMKARMEDPDFDLKVAYLALNKFDLSKLEKQIETKTTKKLRDLISSDEVITKGRSSIDQPQTTSTKIDKSVIKSVLSNLKK